MRKLQTMCVITVWVTESLTSEWGSDLKTSQVRTVLSQEAEASRDCVGLKASPATGPSCPASTSSKRPVRTLHTYTWKVSSEPAHITCTTQQAS